MREFLDNAIEELSTQTPEQLEQLKNKFLEALNLSEAILGQGHRFSRLVISGSKKTKKLNQSLLDVITVCFSEIDNKSNILSNKEKFFRKFKQLLQNDESEFSDSITLGTSTKKAIETRFRIIMALIKEVLDEN